jgi:hypothetical protein
MAPKLKRNEKIAPLVLVGVLFLLAFVVIGVQIALK